MVMVTVLGLLAGALACGGGFGRNSGGGGGSDEDSRLGDLGPLDLGPGDASSGDGPAEVLPLTDSSPDAPAEIQQDGSPEALFDAAFDAPLETLDAGHDAALQADLDAVETGACVPTCEGRVCGEDGCGGLCGECKKGKFCNESFQCETCVPDCEGRVCGADGCGGLCGDCPGGWSCTEAGLCAAPPCSESTITWTEGFGQDLPTGWVVADAQPGDGVSFFPSSVRTHSGDWALHLGREDASSYDGGGRVTLTLETAPLEVPDLEGQVVLSFWLWMDCEPQPSPLYPYTHDVLFINAVPEEGGAPLLLFDSRVTLGSTGGLWLPFGADVSVFKGRQVRLRLDFDTIDELENQREGLYLDDLALGRRCPACLEAGDCAQLGPCPVCVPLFQAGGAGVCESPAAEACGG
jgi:hypothetical protein